MTTTKVGFFSSDDFLRHRTPPGHAERPERLSHLMAYMHSRPLWNLLDHRVPEPAPTSTLLAVHTQDHVDAVTQLCESGGGALDEGDTFAVRDSLEVALLAAGSVLNAVDMTLGGEAPSAFCAVRPPGHHAERGRAMGFCLFNNVAVGARYAQREQGVSRVAIVDWDVHHGNGTQHIFEGDPTVLYVSLHQYPWYPGTGAEIERGMGPGEGYTVNFPLPAGTGERMYLALFHEKIVPLLERFDPGLLIISAGFDAHRDDPLGGMDLREESFGRMTDAIRDVAPTVSVLEGGYHLDALARSVEHHLISLGRSVTDP